MSRAILAACLLVLFALSGRAADLKPLWEIEAIVPDKDVTPPLRPFTPHDKSTAPGWLAYSPDGKAIIAVIVRTEPSDPPEFSYKLRVWDTASRTQRFTTDLGRSRTPNWSDEIVSFISDDSIVTGGQMLVTRDLRDGKNRSTRQTGGIAEHTIWAVPDVNETFQLRREPDREGKPVQLLYHSSTNNIDEFGGRRFRGDDGFTALRQTDIRPPRQGMRTQSVTMNSGRTRLVAAFRDDAATNGKARHSLVLYRIKTIGELSLESIAEATNPHGGPVNALAFARDGKTIATGGEDGSICLWDARYTEAMWKPRATITGADGRVVSLSFSPDWRYVAAITWDTKKPNLWLIDADAGTLVRSVKLDRELTAVAWSPDGKTLLTGGHSGRLTAWDADALLKAE